MSVSSKGEIILFNIDLFFLSDSFSQLHFVFSSPPASLMAILSTCEELCDNILMGVQVGEFAVVQPLSVEYSCILGYLLAWKLLIAFFKSSPSHVSHDKSCFILCHYKHRYFYSMKLLLFYWF